MHNIYGDFIVLNIDLGCGIACTPGYSGVDYQKYTKDVKYIVDLNKSKLPFKNNSVDSAVCNHVLEHLDNPMDLVKEVHRVLKPGAKFIIRVPHYSFPACNVMNHKNYWSFHCKPHFDGSYHEYIKWNNVNFVGKFAYPSRIIRKITTPILNKFLISYPFVYETYLSNFFPIFELEITVVK